MRKWAGTCVVGLAVALATPAGGGAPGEIRRIPDRLDVLSWPGERPPATARAGPAGDPVAVETLAHTGKAFLVVPRSLSHYGDTIRVKATTDGTVVRLNGRIAATLDARETWVATPGWARMRIEATKPVVMSFMVVPAG